MLQLRTTTAAAAGSGVFKDAGEKRRRRRREAGPRAATRQHLRPCCSVPTGNNYPGGSRKKDKTNAQHAQERRYSPAPVVVQRRGQVHASVGGTVHVLCG